MTNRVDWRLGDWAAEYLLHCRVAKNLSPHSLRAYAIDLQDFELWYGTNRALGEVDRSAIRGFLAYLTGPKELAPASVKRRIACLKSFFKWVELEGGVEITPFHRLDLRLRLPKRLPRALEKTEMSMLRRTARRNIEDLISGYEVEDGPQDERFHKYTGWLALEVLYASAVRVSELCAIEVAAVAGNRTHGLQIRGKGDRERWVPIVSEELQIALPRYVYWRNKFLAAKSEKPSALLVSAKGRGLRPEHVRRYLCALAREALGTKHVTPHTLRHTAATHYLRDGLDIRHTQRLLGHSSISTTEIYTAVSDDSLREAILATHR